MRSDRRPAGLQPRPTTVALLSAFVLAAPLLCSGCNRASAGTTAPAPDPHQMDAARQQLDLIPPPSKTRYLAVHSLNDWENPYITVQQNMLTLHVTLADANHSTLGAGGLLRPIGARRQVLNIHINDLPESLDAVPEDSWPYGRVIAVEEAHDIPAADRPAVRRTMEVAMKALGDLGVVVDEWNDAGSGLR